MSSETTTQTVAETTNPIATGTISRDEWDIVGRLLSSFVNETKLQFTDEGIHTQPVDPANVAMVQMDVEFRDWTVRSTDAIVGINIEDITEPMSVLRKMDVDEVNVIITDSEIQYRTDVGYNASFSLIDPDSIRSEPTLPELDLPVSVDMAFIDLYEWFTQNKSHEHMSFRTDSNGLTFEVDTPTANVMKTFKRQALDPHISLFSIDYLYALVKPLLKGQAKQFDVCLSLGTEFPVIMDFIHNTGYQSIDVTYMQAPRIND